MSSIKNSLRRSDARESVNRIFDAALTCLERSPTPSLGSIAAEAGLSTSCVHRYFPTMKDIYVGTLQFILSEQRFQTLELFLQKDIEASRIKELADKLFLDIQLKKRPLQNLICSLAEIDFSRALMQHREALIECASAYFPVSRTPKELYQHKIKVNTILKTLENIFLEQINADPCQIRFETNRRLIKACVGVAGIYNS
jgi:AcrR family transcriptional regulator